MMQNPCASCDHAFGCEYIRGTFDPKKACSKKLLYLAEQERIRDKEIEVENSVNQSEIDLQEGY